MLALHDLRPIGDIHTGSLEIDKPGSFSPATIVLRPASTVKNYSMQTPFSRYSSFPIFGTYKEPLEVDERESMFSATVLGSIDDGETRMLAYAMHMEPLDKEIPPITPQVHVVSTVSIDDILHYEALFP